MEGNKDFPAVAKFVPKVLKILTVPLLKLRPGMTVYLAVREPMRRADPLKKGAEKDSDGKDKLPPMLLPAFDLETGELCEVIPGEILVDILNDKYPNNGYVGKGFMIHVKEQKASAGGGGKRYNTYNVSEIEVPKAEPAVEATPAPGEAVAPVKAVAGGRK